MLCYRRYMCRVLVGISAACIGIIVTCVVISMHAHVLVQLEPTAFSLAVQPIKKQWLEVGRHGPVNEEHICPLAVAHELALACRRRADVPVLEDAEWLITCKDFQGGDYYFEQVCMYLTVPGIWFGVFHQSRRMMWAVINFGIVRSSLLGR